MPQVSMDDSLSATTTGEVKAFRGDYVGPIKNSAPNPGGYWWGCVHTEHGVKHVQEVGKKKTWEEMKRIGAKE